MKVTIIWGFQDAGKTTLINKIFNEGELDEKIMVLQNEEGKETLIKNPGGLELKSMIGGCICCTGSYFLRQSLHEIIQENQYKHIVVEAAGTVQLQSILGIFSEKAFEECENIKTLGVIDSRTFSFKTRLSGPFLKNQILHSDKIIVSKLEESNSQLGIHIRDKILSINPKCEVLIQPLEKLSYEIVMRDIN